MLRSSFALLLLVVPGCVLSPLSLEDRPCPCAAGWRCDTARDVCVPTTGTCTTRAECRAGQACIDGFCVAFDAGPPCFEELETCNGEDDDCDGRSDEGTGLCALPSATARCSAGSCVVDACHTGFADCDTRATNGCEVVLGTTTDCGACGDACTAALPFCAPPATGTTLACAASCPDGATECDGSCVDVETDRQHCGECGTSCAPSHAMGACVAGECTIAACDPGWDDCDDDPSNGCEASLEADDTCGSCTRDCTGMGTPENCMVGRCVSGACMVVAGSEGTICRAAVSLCDVAERCDATGACPVDRFASAGVACRNPTCGGLDPRELCTGTSSECPAPCGCDGEPCCPGPNPCNAGASCLADVCVACTAGAALSGSFPMPAGGSPFVRAVTTTASTLRFADGTAASGTITLPPGVTVSGSFTPPCGTACDWLASVTGSGNTLTLRSGGPSGMPVVTSTLTFVGATTSGTAMPTAITPTLPGYFTSITASGDTLTFVDQAGRTSSVRIVPNPCP